VMPYIFRCSTISFSWIAWFSSVCFWRMSTPKGTCISVPCPCDLVSFPSVLPRAAAPLKVHFQTLFMHKKGNTWLPFGMIHSYLIMSLILQFRMKQNLASTSESIRSTDPEHHFSTTSNRVSANFARRYLVMPLASISSFRWIEIFP